jgi:hypothetical protein
MPKLIVSGQEIQSILSAKVSISSESSLVAIPLKIPIVTFHIRALASRDTLIARWAMQPPGRDRFRQVTLTLYDAQMEGIQRYKLLNAYVRNYAIEEPDSSVWVNGQQLHPIMVLTLEGMLDPAKPFVGDNLMEITGD